MKNPKVLLILFLAFIITSNSYCQNKTFKKGETYVYATEYKDLAKDLIIYDTIQLIITDKPWRKEPKSQKAMIWVYPSTMDTSILSKVYSIGQINRDTTGYIENETEFFLHPPRHHYFTIIELAPFPIVSFPLEKDKEYQRILFMSSGWGEYENLKLKHKYLISGNKEIKWADNTYKVWGIQSESHSELGVSRADFIFNNELGFIEMQYKFYNQVEINIKLIQINK